MADQDGSTVEWRVIKDYPDYEVSSDGRVRRFRGSAGRYANEPLPRELMGFPTKTGRHQVTLKANGAQAAKLVHRLVLEAFVGPCPEGCETAHYDGNHRNNRLENLRWATHQENEADRIRHRIESRGTRGAKVKLTEKDVLEIRASKETQAVLAQRHNVSLRTIRNIKSRRQWKYLDTHHYRFRGVVGGFGTPTPGTTP